MNFSQVKLTFSIYFPGPRSQWTETSWRSRDCSAESGREESACSDSGTFNQQNGQRPDASVRRFVAL